MPELSDDDLKFVLSVDPDDEALNKAIQQINAGIEKAKVSKIKLQLEEAMRAAWAPPKEVIPLSVWEARFGEAGKALESEFDKAAETLKTMQIGMDPEVLRRRILDEHKIADERRKLEKAEQAERVTMAGGPMEYARKKLGADPALIRERLEKENVEKTVRGEMDKTERAERIKMAGGRMQYAWGQLKEGMGSRGGVPAVMGGILGGQGAGMLGQAGGMAGMALGGPVGAMVGEAIAKVVTKIPDAIAAPAKAMVNVLSMVRDGFQDLQGSLGPIGAGLGVVTSGFSAFSSVVKGIPLIGGVLGPLMDAVGSVPGIFKSILETATSLVGKVNPGLMKQFGVALEDAQATVGQAFLPVIQQMIPIIKELGTVIAQALPSDEEMRNIFGSVFASIRELVKEVVPLLGPALNILVTVTRIIIGVVQNLAHVFKNVAQAFGGVFKEVQGGKGREAIAAARQAHMGGIEEYQRQLQLETFQGGRDVGTDPMMTLPVTVTDISGTVKSISAGIVTVIVYAKLAVELLGELLPGGIGKSARIMIEEAERSAKMDEGVQAAKAKGRLQSYHG